MGNPDQFSGHRGFFKEPADQERTIEALKSVLNLNPDGWQQIEKEVIPYLLSHHGLLPEMVQFNQELTEIIRSFLLGERKVLVLGGQPGHGKSLLLTELRKYHSILSSIDNSLNFPLAIIPWDKSRACFYQVVSESAGHEVRPPQGVASQEILELISEVMSDVCQFVLRHYPLARLIVEAPLTGNRGERVVYDLDGQRIAYQIVIMFSEQMEQEILLRGHRDSATSGQPEAMLTIRKQILDQMVGDLLSLSPEQAKRIIIKYWKLFLAFGKEG
jgi:hypothetical protein